MYDPFAPRVNGKRLESSLSIRDPRVHHSMHKPIANAYSLTAMMDYEALVDEMIIKLLAQLQKKITGKNEICDIGLWMRLCMYSVEWRRHQTLMITDAFDVILQVTLSDTLGFMGKGGDIDNFFKNLDINIDYSGLVSSLIQGR